MKILRRRHVPDNIIGILKADPSWEVVNLPKTKARSEEIRDADALLVRQRDEGVQLNCSSMPSA